MLSEATAIDLSSAGVDNRATTMREINVGNAVGEYQIESLLGEGGMGQVYAAVHPRIGKKAAIKVLRTEFCSQPETVERFVQEARAVNQIGHPNIVDIFSFGELPDGRSYFVMEWLKGENLQTRVKRQRLTRNEICDFVEAITRALEAAHEKNIVHRDLKPENVYLHSLRGERPIIKLLDFGIAKLTGDDEQRVERTRTGAIMGTPRYMAPEQARGMEIDHRVDVYSLGVMLFEFVTGQPPFDAQHAMDLIMQHVMQAPPAMSDFVTGVPTAFNDLVRAMMAKNPAERPPLARLLEVLAELRAMPGGDAAFGDRAGARRAVVMDVTGAFTLSSKPKKKWWMAGAVAIAIVAVAITVLMTHGTDKPVVVAPLVAPTVPVAPTVIAPVPAPAADVAPVVIPAAVPESAAVQKVDSKPVPKVNKSKPHSSTSSNKSNETPKRDPNAPRDYQ